MDALVPDSSVGKESACNTRDAGLIPGSKRSPAEGMRPHGMQPSRLHCLWTFSDKNTGAGCHFLLQGIFLTQGSNPHLLHWQAVSLPLSHLFPIWRSSKNLCITWVQYLRETMGDDTNQVNKGHIWRKKKKNLFPSVRTHISFWTRDSNMDYYS